MSLSIGAPKIIHLETPTTRGKAATEAFSLYRPAVERTCKSRRLDMNWERRWPKFQMPLTKRISGAHLGLEVV